MARSHESRGPETRVAESLSEKDQLLIEQYHLVQSIRAELVDRVYSVGSAAIDADSASSELQDKQDAAFDIPNAGLDQSVSNLEDVQNRVRGIISLSIEKLAEMTKDNVLLGQLESYLLSQMSKAARNEIERNPLVLEEGQEPRRTDCWQETSRSSRRKRKK